MTYTFCVNFCEGSCAPLGGASPAGSNERPTDVHIDAQTKIYTINQLANLSGVSARALRYYDQIGLLKPERASGNGYRIYGQAQVDRLQQILFYRELEMPLESIGQLLDAPSFDRMAALEGHLEALLEKKERMETLIDNLGKTIRSMKGEITMGDSEKFEGFKTKLIEKNEEKYGSEIREKYGEGTVAASNEKISGMTQAGWHRQEELSAEITRLLKLAMAAGDPACAEAQEACGLHREWICMFWPERSYSNEAHRGLGEMYAADQRFRDYYEKALGPGGADFLRDALTVYTR